MPLISKAFGDIITFTRASTGSYFDSAGVLQSAAINAPRLDYNPSTLAAQGLLIEEQRTNSIRNNTMVGAVAGTPGTNPTNWNVPSAVNGLTKEIVGTGTTNGITWIDVRWSGTTTAASSTVTQPESSTAITAATGQSWSASAWWAIVGGSTSNITSVNQRVAGRSAAGGLLENTDTPVTLTATITRYAASRTMVNASTERVTNDISFTYNSGVAIDITLRIGLPQLEQGAFATSVIPTSTAAVTRSADVASVNTLTPWFNATEGTFYAEGVAGNLSNSPVFVNASDGTSNNLITSPRIGAAGLARLEGTAGGAAWTAVVTANVITANSVFKAASAFKAGDQAICLNGGTAATGTNASLPVVTSVRLGSFFGGVNFINGYLRRITYYPRRLTNAELQTITA